MFLPLLEALVLKPKTMSIHTHHRTYIPFNILDSDLIKNDMIPVRDTELLGVPFDATEKGVDLARCGDMIIQRLNACARTIHACRSYIKSPKIRVSIARGKIFQCLGELHLIYAYDNKHKKIYNKISKKVNDLIRATGLRNTTPSSVLNKVLGSSLHDFVRQGILTNGLRFFRSNNMEFGRLCSIRQKFNDRTYMSCFVKEWNSLLVEEKKRICSYDNDYCKIKAYLKSRRRLNYDPKIHVDYKWKDYKG